MKDNHRVTRLSHTFSLFSQCRFPRLWQELDEQKAENHSTSIDFNTFSPFNFDGIIGERAKRVRHSQVCSIENGGYYNKLEKLFPLQGERAHSFNFVVVCMYIN